VALQKVAMVDFIFAVIGFAILNFLLFDHRIVLHLDALARHSPQLFGFAFVVPAKLLHLFDQFYELLRSDGVVFVGELYDFVFDDLVRTGVRQETVEVSAVQRGFFLNFYSLASMILYKTFNFMSRRCFLCCSWITLFMRRIDFRSFAKKWFFTLLSVLNQPTGTVRPGEGRSLPIYFPTRYAGAATRTTLLSSSPIWQLGDSGGCCIYV
jgi:hypothetical protein